MTETDESPAKSSERSRMPQGSELFWWCVLIVSVLVGFGMTIFAPI